MGALKGSPGTHSFGDCFGHCHALGDERFCWWIGGCMFQGSSCCDKGAEGSSGRATCAEQERCPALPVALSHQAVCRH